MYNTPDLVVRAFGQEPAKEMNDEADEAKTAVTVEAGSPCLSELVWINAFLSTREFKFEADDTLVEAESSCQRLGMWYLRLTIAGDGWCLIVSLPSFRNRFDRFFLLLPWFPTPSHMVALWWLLLGQFSQETRAFAALLIRRRARPRITSTRRVALVIAGWVSWWFWIAPNVSLSQCSRWHVWGVSLWIRQGRDCCDRGNQKFKIQRKKRDRICLQIDGPTCLMLSGHVLRIAVPQVPWATRIIQEHTAICWSWVLYIYFIYIQRIERNQGFTVVIKSLKCYIFFIDSAVFFKNMLGRLGWVMLA